MALKVVWTKEANEGLDEIIEYLEQRWTEKEISKFFIRLEDCLEQIKAAPQRLNKKSGYKRIPTFPKDYYFL